MHENVIQALQTQQKQPVDKTSIAELVEKEITLDHPKVRDLIQQSVVETQEKMHKLREQHIQDVFNLEKQLQEVRFEKEAAIKELNLKKTEAESSQREKLNSIQQVASTHQNDLQQQKEEFSQRIEKL